MTEDEKRAAGQLFCPGDPELKAQKLKAHKLDTEYNMTFEDETEKRSAILKELIGEMGPGSFIQGPVQFHYGIHTKIGKNFFGNFNLTVQDDANVEIGDNCNFFAAGNPCRVIREITEKDSMIYKPEIMAENRPMEGK